MKFLREISLMAVIISAISIGSADLAGANVAQDLTANYNKIVKNCGSSDQPAYLCSGNLIRFTTNNHDYLPWEAPPTAYKNENGVSFMFTRRDIKNRLSFNGQYFGVIYYPPLIRPQGKLQAKFSCVFPIDADTNERVKGCGVNAPDSKVHGSESDNCQDQGIYTAQAWYQHFISVPKAADGANWTRGIHQCGFNVAEGTENRADIFNEMLKSRDLAVSEGIVEGDTFMYYNEMIMKLWPADSNGHISNAQDLPIQAFFYTTDSNGNSGLEDARFFQKRYYDLNNHIVIPIVKLYQDSSFKKVSYSYNIAEQSLTK
ncbi:hypothetical protein [Commensalibacter communis]|uniref:hypothetical protein n=1 Tax=Commensalibacter communis TaxID=2972786 RepID=UPI0022FFB91D|nr:hypothetical protein [Commensalibacter communis]CAI3959193.1 unnamed protein product [Commensalibacter communis]CAI3959197.1 unnamed protein product [Commensalibacter communis]